jgi:hypothetical protein
VFQAIGCQKGPVGQLDVDVEVVIVAPRRQLILFHPRALQRGRDAARRGISRLFPQREIPEVLQLGIGQVALAAHPASNASRSILNRWSAHRTHAAPHLRRIFNITQCRRDEKSLASFSDHECKRIIVGSA